METIFGDPALHCTSAAWVSRREAAQTFLTLPKCDEMMALAQGERQEQAWTISFLNPPCKTAPHLNWGDLVTVVNMY